MRDEKFLYLPLIQAERAWGYAMQLKQEANTEPRKKFHLISRLRKAVTHALHLEYICQSPLCDARTKLEAQAYSAWMQGTLHFELQEWKLASEKLLLAQTIYEKLASALNEDEQVLYKQRVDELNPNLRYCAYNIGDSTAQQDLLKMRSAGGKSELDTLIAQTREKQAASLLELTWRGRTVPVRLEKIRLFLLAYQSLGATLKAAGGNVDDELSVYETLLLDCKEAIQSLREDSAAALAKGKVEGSLQTGSQQYLLSYLTFLRVVLTVDRNLVMLDVFKKNFAASQVLSYINSVALYHVLLYLCFIVRFIERSIQEDGKAPGRCQVVRGRCSVVGRAAATIRSGRRQELPSRFGIAAQNLQGFPMLLYGSNVPRESSVG